MRNVIHTEGNHQIELTGKGKFLVRDSAGRELDQLNTQDAALQKIADEQQRRSSAVQAGNERYAQRDGFFAQHSDLQSQQLNWQEWRSKLFEANERLARYLQAHERNLNRVDASAHYFDRLEQDQAALRDAQLAYQSAVSIDTRLKSASFAGDETAYRQALADAQALMSSR